MNTTLFRSVWALAGFVISAAFVGWMVLIQAPAGARDTPAQVTLLLWSGWVTFGLMVGVCVYSLRKYVHKLGISPEFKLRVPDARLEEAERLMNELRRRILMGLVDSERAVADEAARILRECEVHRVCKPRVLLNRSAGPKFLVSVVPTEPLGRMKRWLHFHVYLGLASGVVLYVHGGATLGSPIGAAMNILTAVVILTGVLGTFLFAFGPRWMTRAEKDMNFEDAFVLAKGLKTKIKNAYAALKPEQVKVFRKAERTTATVVMQRTSLKEAVGLEPAARKEMEDVMVLVSQRRRIMEDLQGAARIKFLINVWRAVHLPASIVLIAVAIIHVVSVIWY